MNSHTTNPATRRGDLRRIRREIDVGVHEATRHLIEARFRIPWAPVVSVSPALPFGGVAVGGLREGTVQVGLADRDVRVHQYALLLQDAIIRVQARDRRCQDMGVFVTTIHPETEPVSA